ncbi:WD40 repeat domain-containing protein [Streptomyces beihaiensis]|uniref:WD40 repeat domain-containing protein n=1 Tax=Streptomyces beihaiensis TaxID=2984495 RepID=A0ABT3U2V3_9ACTN|nr:WD40 repeat domain-containing protein [Streptomyces beihaiensis]MCX3063621.1 WD40 repeat domain-containing protein [Streptomyces beihaiensis]
MRANKVRATVGVGAAAAVAAVLFGSGTAPATADSRSPGSDGFTITDPRITESSGLAASHIHPGVYWTHNDSGDGPYIYAIDGRTGKTVARVTFTGVGRPRDDEAISIGPDDNIYVGDIGDNSGGSWNHVWIYKLPEPKVLRDQTVRATQYTVKYEDGPRNAETLLVHPKTGRVYIVSKNENGGALYEGPATLSPTRTNYFKRVTDIDLWVTDGAFSPDGKQLALRGYFGGISYAWKNGRPKREGQLDVPLQPQGESVTYTRDGKTLLFGSEGKDSKVQPVPVKGAAGGSGSSGGATGATASGAGTAANDNPHFTGKAGAVGVAALLIVVFGIGRLVRRKPRS